MRRYLVVFKAKNNDGKTVLLKTQRFSATSWAGARRIAMATQVQLNSAQDRGPRPECIGYTIVRA